MQKTKLTLREPYNHDALSNVWLSFFLQLAQPRDSIHFSCFDIAKVSFFLLRVCFGEIEDLGALFPVRGQQFYFSLGYLWGGLKMINSSHSGVW